MGTETEPRLEPEPVPPGNQCDICWGLDKPLGNRTTPSKLEAIFTGIGKAPDWSDIYGEPINGSFILEQDPVYSCFYSAELADFFTINLNFWDTGTSIQLDKPGILMFESYTNNVCNLFMLNDITSIFIGGTCLIALPEVTE